MPLHWISVFLIVLGTTSHPADGILPLRDQWKAAVSALQRNEPVKAATLFREFDHWYGNEPEVEEATFRERWYRLWGLAALQTGELDEGIRILGTWLDDHPHQTRFRAFIRFQMGLACRSSGRAEEAVHHWSVFVSKYPELPECALVHWMWAELDISQSKSANAKEHMLNVLSEERLPGSGQSLAHAAMALIDLSNGDHESALEQLSKCNQGKVSEIWRSVLAPSLTNELNTSGNPDAALEASRWFSSPAHLRKSLRELPDLSGKSSPRGVIWRNHWRNQLGYLRTNLENIIDSGFQLKHLYEMRLQTLLESDRAEDAYLLSRAFLKSQSDLALSLRSTAYASGIRACQIREQWDEANALADAFLNAFPNDPALPEILFLQAKTAAGRKDPLSAVQRMEKLISRFPEHDLILKWRIATAGWRLDSGQPESALEEFVQLESVCRKSWLPSLRFQIARCWEALSRPGKAKTAFQEVTQMKASPALMEQAWIGILKIHLANMDCPGFRETVQDYRHRHTDGLYRDMVNLLDASAYELSGDLDRAIRIYQQITGGTGSTAEHALTQLSRIHAAREDYLALREHALDWIQKWIERDAQLPVRGLSDCLLYQSATGKAALPAPLFKTLSEGLDTSRFISGGDILLQLVMDGWEDYNGWLDTHSKFDGWLKAKVDQHHANGRWNTLSIYKLFHASLLEQDGRHDSADTHRIALLSLVDTKDLPESSLFELAKTADKYDFPEANSMLKTFLGKYSKSSRYPLALRRLAERTRKVGERNQSLRIMEEIISDWSDCPGYIPSAVQLAKWYHEDGLLEKSAFLSHHLLGLGGMSPRETATILLTRAKVDLAQGRRQRCLLSCRRIHTLYSSFHDINDEAQAILRKASDA
jgi:tetratricopeptide (TPR) repeat protein